MDTTEYDQHLRDSNNRYVTVRYLDQIIHGMVVIVEYEYYCIWNPNERRHQTISKQFIDSIEIIDETQFNLMID